jgi:very-short-patch-repair endonuclease
MTTRSALEHKLKRNDGGSDVEDDFLFQIKAVGLPVPYRQAKVIKDRRYRWDFCWPERNLLVEIQGGIWIRGAHARGGGIERDCEKNNLAVLAGYRCLQFTSGMVSDGSALTFLEKVLK